MNYSIVASMSDKSPFNIADAVKRYGVQLLSFIKSKVKILEDAEDVLQDVWYQFSNISSPEDIESVSGWLYRVARNKITDRYRKQNPELLEDYIFEGEDGELNIRELLLADDSNNPELFLFKETFWNTFNEALSELPEKQRMVFVQNELEDKTLQEIADENSESLKTIISRKGYAVKHLREKLAPLYQELYQ